MHTVELMDSLCTLAEHLGYTLRQEWLGGTGGGKCEMGGRRYIFIDLALSILEQQEQVAAALQDDPAIFTVSLAPAVKRALGLRKVA